MKNYSLFHITMTLFNNKYRIESTRATWWNYSGNGAYFITIVTKNRRKYFGEIKNKKLEPSPIGEIANACWLEIPDHFPFVKLGVHIIMPDHIHGIVIIDKSGNDSFVDPPSKHKASSNKFSKLDSKLYNELLSTDKKDSNDEINSIFAIKWEDRIDPIAFRETVLSFKEIVSNKPADYKNKFAPQSKNLASVIRGFKVGVTKNARKINPDFAWLPRYHDVIIRNKIAFERISQYIHNNPSNWKGQKKR